MKPFLFSLILCCSIAFAQTEEKVLVDREVEVLRADYKEFHFRVPEEGNFEFVGSFGTSGGFNDDITFLVLTQENYVRWFSRYEHQTALKLEKAKASNFHVEAKPGETYYFVLYNFFSTVTNKKVRLTVKLIPIKS